MVRSHPVGVLVARPCVDAVTYVPPAPLSVGCKGCAPDALGSRELGAVSVSDVANALGGQRVAGFAPSSSAFDQAPGIHEAVHHLANPGPRRLQASQQGVHGESSGGRSPGQASASQPG